MKGLFQKYFYNGLFKSFLAVGLILSVLIGLCACGGGYVSSYKAVGLVRSNTSHSCEASFYSLEGTLVFKLKKTDGAEGEISYSVAAEEGEISLYYDIYGTKEQLVNVKAGDTAEGTGGYVEGGKQVYIIIEASKKSRGRVSVEMYNG